MVFMKVSMPSYKVQGMGPYFPSNIYISCCPRPVKIDNEVVDFKLPKTQVGRKI